jgi:ABC-type lipopolysaccharide export system ATPase subunit
VIASGEPTEVRNNPAVVASYLGTDVRAIERSDSGTTS